MVRETYHNLQVSTKTITLIQNTISNQIMLQTIKNAIFGIQDRIDKIGPVYCHTPLSIDLRDKILEELFEEQRKILSKKGNDYAGDDILSNFRLAGMIVNQSSKHPDAINCLNLIGTKVARLGQLLNTDKHAQNESIQDSVIDLANYASLLYIMLKMER